MTTIIRLGWAGSSACEPDLFASGPASFKNLRSRETSSKPRSCVCGLLKKTRWLPTRNTNSSFPCGWTSPRCSTSSTASRQLRLWGSLPLRRFWYSGSRCFLMVCDPSQKRVPKLDQRASRAIAIETDVMLLPNRASRKARKCLLRVVVSWIVVRADVFKPKRPNRGHLRYVLTGFRPMEMGRIARQNDDASWRICLQLFRIELLAQADVENARDYCIDTVFRVPVRHQLNAMGHSNPDGVGSGLQGLTHDDSQADRMWERREGLPVDVFGQDRFENVLTWLMRCNHTLLWSRHDGCSLV